MNEKKENSDTEICIEGETKGFKKVANQVSSKYSKIIIIVVDQVENSRNVLNGKWKKIGENEGMCKVCESNTDRQEPEKEKQKKRNCVENYHI